MTRKKFTVRIAERINKNESGDTIIWNEFNNLEKAKAFCEKVLKTDARVYSAWIETYTKSGDLQTQWIKYVDELGERSQWRVYENY